MIKMLYSQTSSADMRSTSRVSERAPRFASHSRDHARSVTKHALRSTPARAKFSGAPRDSMVAARKMHTLPGAASLREKFVVALGTERGGIKPLTVRCELTPRLRTGIDFQSHARQEKAKRRSGSDRGGEAAFASPPPRSGRFSEAMWVRRGELQQVVPRQQSSAPERRGQGGPQ